MDDSELTGSFHENFNQTQVDVKVDAKLHVHTGKPNNHLKLASTIGSLGLDYLNEFKISQMHLLSPNGEGGFNTVGGLTYPTGARSIFTLLMYQVVYFTLMYSCCHYGRGDSYGDTCRMW